MKSRRSRIKFQKFGQIVTLTVLFFFIMGTIILGGLGLRSGSKSKNPPPPVAPRSPVSSSPEQDDVSRWQEAVKDNPRDPFVFRNLARAEIAKGKLKEAQAAAEKARRLSPNSPMNEVLLAQIAVGQGNPAEGLTHYEKALSMAPGSAGVELEYADALATSGQEDKAKAIYEKVVAENPQSVPWIRARSALLLLFMREENLDQAEKQAMALYRVEAANVEILRILGEIAERRHHVNEALLYEEKALRLSPDDLDLMRRVAKGTGTRGDDSRARALWSALVDRNPQDFEAKYELALIDLRTGKKEEARRLLERALQQARLQKDAQMEDRIRSALKLP